MSGKKSSSYDTRCTSGTSQGHFPQLILDKPGASEKSAESGSLTFQSSEKSVYDSRYSDSGVWSGSNIHSEELQSLDTPESPKAERNFMSSSGQVSGEKSSTYMRLDSGIDVSQHLSELSLKDKDSYNDLSAKDIIVNSKDSSVSTSKSSYSPYPVTDQDLVEYCFQQNEDGDTDLHLAIVHEFIETVYALVRLAPHPKYLNIRNNDRQTPLHLAVLTRQPRLVRLLICAGAAVDELDRCGNTALHLAVQDCSLPSVQAIITPVTVPEIYQAQLQYTPCFSNRQIVNIHNYEGQTCLHLAALSDSMDIFQHLLWAGADINAKEWKGGQTCLHLAVERRNLELCMFLLRQEKMDPDETSYSGHTAYQTACSGWDNAIADILRRHGVDTYESDSDTESEDDDMLENSYSCLKVNGGGLVDVGA